MQTVRIYRLKGLAPPTRTRLRAAQMEAARVWNLCCERHQDARHEHRPWPDRDALQQATKGSQFAPHSQSIQMVCHQFLANVQTTRQLKPSHPRMRYPFKPKQYMTLQWPAQAVARQGKRLILPMGRGRKALCFRLNLPELIGGVSLVWHGGYELHVTVPASSAVVAPGAAQATIDLGEIHLAAVTTSTGQGLIVSGRGIRSLKRRHNKGLGQLQRKQARCTRGSRRYRALQRAKARLRARTERQVRDRRHKATQRVVRFLQQEGVGMVFIGDPHGVRDQQCGRHHHQRMSQWEYGKDKDYLQQKSAQAGILSFTGSERGTSSRCPNCQRRQRVRGRNWVCKNPQCRFAGHRDIVGSLNMHRLAFGRVIAYPLHITYLRPSRDVVAAGTPACGRDNPF
jgi:putative transposase